MTTEEAWINERIKWDPYGKIFRSTYTGSMYGAGLAVHAVWPWILAHCDENGNVEVNPVLVKDELGCETQDILDAITFLTSPDPNSRSTAAEGRRIIKTSQFGYRVVNRREYNEKGRDRTTYWRNYRAQKRATGCATGAQVAQPKITQVEEEVEVEVDKDVLSLGKKEPKKARTPKVSTQAERRAILQEFDDEFWPQVPHHIGKGAARRAYVSARQKVSKQIILAALPKYHDYEKERAARSSDGFRPLHPSTWLNQERWEDEVVLTNPARDHRCRQCGKPADFCKRDNAGVMAYSCKSCQPKQYELMTGKKA